MTHKTVCVPLERIASSAAFQTHDLVWVGREGVGQGVGGGGPAGGCCCVSSAGCSAGRTDIASEGGINGNSAGAGGSCGGSSTGCSAGRIGWAGEGGVDGDSAGAGRGEDSSGGTLSGRVAACDIGEAAVS
jgi:hypothetical protein